MARYYPPRSIQTPWLRAILQADPDFNRERKREPEYEFSKKTFRADQSARGVYGVPYDTDDPEFAEANRTENGH